MLRSGAWQIGARDAGQTILEPFQVVKRCSRQIRCVVVRTMPTRSWAMHLGHLPNATEGADFWRWALGCGGPGSNSSPVVTTRSRW